MKIEVTFEKRMRVAMEFDATKEQIESLKRGENPFRYEMEKEIASGTVEYDYAVCDLKGNGIVPWGQTM